MRNTQRGPAATEEDTEREVSHTAGTPQEHFAFARLSDSPPPLICVHPRSSAAIPSSKPLAESSQQHHSSTVVANADEGNLVESR